MDKIACLNNAVEASKKEDITMLKFWLDQYEFKCKKEEVQRELKNLTCEMIEQRMQFRNPLTVAALGTEPCFSNKRVIYHK